MKRNKTFKEVDKSNLNRAEVAANASGDYEKIIPYNNSNLFKSKVSQRTSQLNLIKKQYSRIHNAISKGNHSIANIGRDISIETDICILRRYIKRKINETNEITQIKKSTSLITRKKLKNMQQFNENNYNNLPTSQIKNTNIDLTTRFLKNLIELLYDWIKNQSKNYNNSHRKQRQRNSFTSSNFSLKLKKSRFSSTNNSTSLLIKDMSHQSVPLARKTIHLISTLSIPRHFGINEKWSTQCNRRIARRLTPITFPSKVHNYETSIQGDIDSIKDTSESNMDQYIHTSPYNVKQDFSSINEKITSKYENLENCFLQSYTVSNSTNKYRKKNINKSKNRVNICTSDTISYLHEIKRDKDTNLSNILRSSVSLEKYKETCPSELPISLDHKKNKFKYKNIHQKSFSFSMKSKDSDYFHAQKNKLHKHINNIFDCFSHCNRINPVKFNVFINVYSSIDNENNKSLHKRIGNTDLYSKLKYTPFDCNISPNKCKLNSKCECLINVEALHSLFSKVANSNNKSNTNTLLNDLFKNHIIVDEENNSKRCDSLIKYDNFLQKVELSPDIKELRSIIKQLANTTDKFINEFLVVTKSMYTQSTNNGHKMSQRKYSSIIKSVNNISNPMQSKHPILKNAVKSGIKLLKLPSITVGNKLNDNENRKSDHKCVSYKILDSETFINITDMLSQTGDVRTNDVEINKSVTCSISTKISNKPKENIWNKICKMIRGKQKDIVSNISLSQYCCSNNDLICPVYDPSSASHKTCSSKTRELYCTTSASEENKSCTNTDIEIGDICSSSKKTSPLTQSLLFCFLIWIPLTMIIVTIFVCYKYIYNTNFQTAATYLDDNSVKPMLYPQLNLSALAISNLGF